MNEMEQNAKELKLTFDKLGIQKAYISKQTGLKEKEVNAFLEIADDMAMADGFDYNRIYNAMKQFIDSELVVGNFKYIDDTEFSDILRKLIEEFRLSDAKLEWLIRQRIETNYSVQEREKNMEFMSDFSCYQISKHGMDIFLYTAELLSDDQIKLNQLRAEYAEIDDFLIYGISSAVDFDSETGDIIEGYFSPEKIECMSKRHSELETEIKKLESEISDLLHQNEQDREEFNALFHENNSSDSSFSESLRIEKSIKRTARHNFNKKNYAYNAVQQKNILELFFELCTDKNGYVLPDHFGSGIHLAVEIKEESVWTGNWKNLQNIQKVTYWATDNNIHDYEYNDSISIIEPDDSVYRFIHEHLHVFFHDPGIQEIESFMRMLRDVPRDVKRKLFYKLIDESIPIIPRTDKERKYYVILSEYYDILSLQIPVANFKSCKEEKIYRIVYEIAAASNGSIKFSNKLVHSVFQWIHFKAVNWLWRIYLSQYYYHHKEFESLIAYIEKETIEPEI